MSQEKQGTLEVEGVHKAFGQFAALNGVTFAVRPGEIFGFVGSNGAGKTTTMRTILGVLEPDAGQIRYGGAPITDAVRRTIGYMPEERGLYPKMKVGAQLTYLARLHGQSRAEAEELTAVWTRRLGISERTDDPVEKLSLGNQQRVQLAAALLHRPKILVLDEPFSGLDPLAVEVMSGVLRELADTGVPVLFSSHQLELVDRLSDRVGIIKAGTMVAVGTAEELRSKEQSRYRIETTMPIPADALAGIPIARLDVHDETHCTVTPGDVRPEDLLAAISAHVPVVEFARERPSLAELYKEVVIDE